VVDEGLAAGGLEGLAGVVVGLQEQPVEEDECDEQVVDVEPVSTEHAARAHAAQWLQEFDAVSDQFVICHGSSCTIGPPSAMGPCMTPDRSDELDALRKKLIAARQALPDRLER